MFSNNNNRLTRKTLYLKVSRKAKINKDDNEKKARPNMYTKNAFKYFVFIFLKK